MTVTPIRRRCQSNLRLSKIQLGVTLTQGRCRKPSEQGEQAAIENLDDIRDLAEGTTKMVS